MTVAEQVAHERQNLAINAAADALLAVCALQTGLDPWTAYRRAHTALGEVLKAAEAEARAADLSPESSFEG